LDILKAFPQKIRPEMICIEADGEERGQVRKTGAEMGYRMLTETRENLLLVR
jgi:hypothetical protein